MVSLILQNLYREILTVADENGGRLKNRVVFFADELGTCPPIQSLELMFSASRSRGLMLVPIVQSITGQLQKNYGKEGSERSTFTAASPRPVRPRWNCPNLWAAGR